MGPGKQCHEALDGRKTGGLKVNGGAFQPGLSLSAAFSPAELACACATSHEPRKRRIGDGVSVRFYEGPRVHGYVLAVHNAA